MKGAGNLNLSNNKRDITVELLKNKDDVITVIPNEYCSVKYNFGTFNELTLKIPKYIMRNGSQIFNKLYSQINIRQQIIVTIGAAKEKYIITSLNDHKILKSGSEKVFKCLSFEAILKNQRITFDLLTRMLKKDLPTYVNDGYLDEIEKHCPYKFTYVDRECLFKRQKANETVDISLYHDFVLAKVEQDGLIFQKDITTNTIAEHAVYTTLKFNNLKTIDNEGRILKTENIEIKLKPYYTNITWIRVNHYSGTSNRFGLKVTATLDDGQEMVEEVVFTNIINKRIECKEIVFTYGTGNIVEGEVPIYTTIEGYNDNIYSLLEKLRELYNCTFIFDNINMEVKVLANSNLIDEVPMQLDFDTSIISVSSKATDVVPNCLVVTSDKTSISGVNPYGGEALFDYSYYIKNNFFDEEMVEKLNRYNELLLIKQQEYESLKNTMSDKQSLKTKKDSEISSLEYRITYYYNLLAGLIAGNSNEAQQKDIKDEITSLEARLNTTISERMIIQDDITELTDSMLSISSSIQKETAADTTGKIFSVNDLVILEQMLYVEILDNSYYTTPESLYLYAQQYFEDLLTQKVELTIDCEDFSKNTRNELDSVLKLGSLFFIEVDEVDDKKVRFISYEFDFESQRISDIKFTNKINESKKLNIGTVGRAITKSENVIRTFSDVWEDSKLQTNFVGGLIEGGLNLATSKVNAKSDRNLLDFGEYGSFWKDAEHPTDGNQIYIGNSLIAISKDGFKTSSVAIDANGVIAEKIVGSILLGEQVHVTTESGQFSIGLSSDKARMGVHVKDEVLRDRIFLGLEKKNGVQVAKLELRSADGTQVVLDERGIISEYQYTDRSSVDSDSAMYSYLRLQDNVNEIIEAIISIKLLPFRTYSRGLEGGGRYVKSVSSKAGGGSTSGAGGSYRKSFGTTSSTDSFEGVSIYTGTDKETPTPGDTGHYHAAYVDGRSHNHSVSLSVSIPSHTHSIKSHTHSVDINIPTHNHELTYGCIDLDGAENLPSNVTLYINGVKVIGDINADKEINITKYLRKGVLNEIKLTSSTRGNIYINLYNKSFILW